MRQHQIAEPWGQHSPQIPCGAASIKQYYMRRQGPAIS